MKILVLALAISFQTIIFSSAHAWSPLDGYEAFNERPETCYSTVAGSEESQEGGKKKETEEEEPDCE